MNTQRFFRVLVAMAVLATSLGAAEAEDLIAIADANWNVASTWDANTVPTSISSVEVNDHTVTVANAGAVAMTVTVDANDHLKINSGAGLSVGYQMDTTGGTLTVDGTLTAVDLTIGGTNNIGAAATVTAVDTLTVTNSVLDMTDATLDVSTTALVAIELDANVVLNQMIMTARNVYVGGELILQGTTAMIGNGGTVTIDGTADVYINGTSSGFYLAETASLAFSGNGVMNLDFDAQIGSGEYWGLRWAGQHVGTFNGWLGDGSITTSGDTSGLTVGYDGNFTSLFRFPKLPPRDDWLIGFDNLSTDTGWFVRRYCQMLWIGVHD